MGEWEAWLKAGTGDDKTNIVVIADFWERTGGSSAVTANLSSNGVSNPLGWDWMLAAEMSLAALDVPAFRLTTEHVFRPGRSLRSSA